MYLLIFESLGMSEMLVILVVALVLFGPRKLPQLSRSLGKSLAEFKRASEDFKRTWEQEVSMEDAEKTARIEHAMLPPEENSIMNPTVARENAHARFIEDVQSAADEKTAGQNATPSQGMDSKLLPQASGESLAHTPQTSIASNDSPAYAEEPTTSKRDWL